MAEPEPIPADAAGDDSASDWFDPWYEYLDREQLRLAEIELFDFWPCRPAPSDYLDRCVRSMRGPSLLGTTLDLLALVAGVSEEHVLAHCPTVGRPGSLAIHLPEHGPLVVARFRFVEATPRDLEAARG